MPTTGLCTETCSSLCSPLHQGESLTSSRQTLKRIYSRRLNVDIRVLWDLWLYDAKSRSLLCTFRCCSRRNIPRLSKCFSHHRIRVVVRSQPRRSHSLCRYRFHGCVLHLFCLSRFRDLDPRSKDFVVL